jgi:hypothetical protein
MKRSRSSEEQVVRTLRESQSEMTVKAVWAKHNISEVPQMRAMHEEISRLNRLIADGVVRNDILKG